MISVLDMLVKQKLYSFAGSRLTNFVGILSQGLRIAPPEAPATGYMVPLPTLSVSLSCVVCVCAFAHVHV